MSNLVAAVCQRHHGRLRRVLVQDFVSKPEILTVQQTGKDETNWVTDGVRATVGEIGKVLRVDLLSSNFGLSRNV